MLDTAASYQNEEAVGRAIRSGDALGRHLRDHQAMVQHPGEANATAAFERSLERLGTDHVDLYLIHQPLGDYYSSWRAMEKLHTEAWRGR